MVVDGARRIRWPAGGGRLRSLPPQRVRKHIAERLGLDSLSRGCKLCAVAQKAARRSFGGTPERMSDHLPAASTLSEVLHRHQLDAHAQWLNDRLDWDLMKEDRSPEMSRR